MSSTTGDLSPILVSVDVTNLIHRAWHACGQMNDPHETIGLTLLWVAAACERVHATHVALCGDDPTGCAPRKAIYPAYKAGRPSKPQGLRDALAMTPLLCAVAGLPVTIIPGAEADDLMASTAEHYAATGTRVALLTGDRDAFSLLDRRVAVLRLLNGGPESWPIVRADQLVDMYGVTPTQYPFFASMRGDASDNMPGLNGIGEKRAAAIVQHFRTPDAFLVDLRRGGQQTAGLIGAAKARTLAEDHLSVEQIIRLNIALSTALHGLPPAQVIPLPISEDQLYTVAHACGLGHFARERVRRILADPR